MLHENMQASFFYKTEKQKIQGARLENFLAIFLYTKFFLNYDSGQKV